VQYGMNLSFQFRLDSSESLYMGFGFYNLDGFVLPTINEQEKLIKPDQIFIIVFWLNHDRSCR